MKSKHLEIKLQQHVKYFAQPKIELEQFHTPPDIAATVVHFMFSSGDVEGEKRAVWSDQGGKCSFQHKKKQVSKCATWVVALAC